MQQLEQPPLDRISMSARTSHGASRRVVVGKVFETHDAGQALGIQVTTDGIRVGSSCLNEPDRGGQLIHVSSSTDHEQENQASQADDEEQKVSDDGVQFANVTAEVRRHVHPSTLQEMPIGQLIEEGEESAQVMRAYPNVDEIIRDDLQEMYQERLDRNQQDDMYGL